jgi:rod shape-determining protein MreB and related proteins
MGTVVNRSIPIGGDGLDLTIMQRIKKEHNLLIGKLMARSIKHKLGTAYPSAQSDQQEMEVRGLDLRSSLPRWFNIRGGEVREYLSGSLAAIATHIKQVLEQTPPELAADILERGMMLTGGGALLNGIDLYLSREVGILAQVAPAPLAQALSWSGFQNCSGHCSSLLGQSVPSTLLHQKRTRRALNRFSFRTRHRWHSRGRL